MHVTDLMTRPVLTVRVDDTLEHAAALLSGHRIAAAPVLDGAGDLVGMISEGDVLRARRDAATAALLVADVMTRDVVAVSMDADLSEVAEAMLSWNVHSVPIVDAASEVAGIICRHDLLRAYVRTDDTTELEVQHRLDEYAGGGRVWTATVRNSVADITGPYLDEVERHVVNALARTVAGVSGVTQHA